MQISKRALVIVELVNKIKEAAVRVRDGIEGEFS